MATVVQELRAKTDAAYANLSRQLQGMEAHLDRAEGPGEWTARQVLCHLLFEPDWNPVDTLRTFSHTNLPVILAGHAGGRVETGRFRTVPSQPMCNLFLDMLQHFGVEGVNRFGDSTGQRIIS